MLKYQTFVVIIVVIILNYEREQRLRHFLTGNLCLKYKLIIMFTNTNNMERKIEIT